MPINLRYDLRIRRDKTLATRLAAAWQLIDALRLATVKPGCRDIWHGLGMRRSFIRARWAYRLKARLHVAMHVVGSIGQSGEAWFIVAPFLVLAWLILPRETRSETLGEYNAFLLKCEIEDLQDELQRRLENRKRRQTT